MMIGMGAIWLLTIIALILALRGSHQISSILIGFGSDSSPLRWR